MTHSVSLGVEQSACDLTEVKGSNSLREPSLAPCNVAEKVSMFGFGEGNERTVEFGCDSGSQ